MIRFLSLAFGLALAAMQMSPAAAQSEDVPLENAEPTRALVESAPDNRAISPAERVIDPNVSVAELSHLLVPLTREELEDVSRTWFSLVRAKTQQIAALQADRARNPQDVDDPRIDSITTLVEQRARLLERFTLVVNSLDRKGGDTDLVTELRDYRQAILYEETEQASTQALIGSFFAWLVRSDGGLAVLARIFVAVIALVLIIFVARLFRVFARLWMKRSGRISSLLQAFIAAAVFWVVILAGLVLVLASVDVDVTPLIALIGGASFILAFAFQDTLGNLASGLMIMVNQPFDEGDFIEVAGVGGTVKKVSLVGTTIATLDNKIVVVPNKSVWGNVIVNATASDIRRVDLVFGASYDDRIQDVLNVLYEVVEAHPKVLADPAPDIRAHDLAASSVNFVCRPWVRSEDYWDVSCDLTRNVKEAFDEAGLSLPYPQQEIHIKTTAG